MLRAVITLVVHLIPSEYWQNSSPIKHFSGLLMMVLLLLFTPPLGLALRWPCEGSMYTL